MSKPNVRILNRGTRPLPCPLTEHERAELSTELGRVMEDIENEELRQKEAREEMKHRLSSLVARRGELAAKARRGEEDRDVEVETRAHLDDGEIVVVRLDTEEIHERRPMTTEERQRTFGEEEVPERPEGLEVGAIAAYPCPDDPEAEIEGSVVEIDEKLRTAKIEVEVDGESKGVEEVSWSILRVLHAAIDPEPKSDAESDSEGTSDDEIVLGRTRVAFDYEGERMEGVVIDGGPEDEYLVRVGDKVAENFTVERSSLEILN